MNEKMLPVLAIILSLVAISAAVVIQPESKIKVGSIDSKELAKDSVTSSELADNKVTTDDIADETITDNDINNSGITKIKNFSIKSYHLTKDLYGNLAGTANLANGSITSEKIKDYDIESKDISNNSIGSNKIIDNTVNKDDIASNAVGNDELQDDSVDGDNIVDESVGSEDIENGGIHTNDLSENAITEFWQENPGLGPEYIDNTSEQSDFVNLTNATINITTGNNAVLFLFSGVFCNTNAMEPVQIMMFIDNEMITPTTRKGTSVQPSSTFTLSFNYIETLSEGTHNVEVRWRAPDGAGDGQAFNRVLDIIELKK